MYGRLLSRLVKNLRGHALTIAGIITIAAVVTNACRNPTPFGKRKRQANEQVDLADFISPCLGNVSNRTLQWDGIVAFTIQTTWYIDTVERCSVHTNSTTVTECWIKRANQFFYQNSDLLDSLKSCIISYFISLGVNYTGSTFPSNETQEPFDDVLCPDVQVSQFISGFQESLEDFEMDNNDTVDYLPSLIEVFQGDIICPTCSCRDLSENVGTLEEFGFENTALECNQCWSTRIGSMLQPRAPLARIFGLTSLRIAGLRAVDNCTGDFIKLDNPEFQTLLDAEVICSSDRIAIRLNRCALVNVGLDFIYETVIADRNENLTARTTYDPDCEPLLYSNPNFDDIEFFIQGDFNKCGAVIEVNQSHITFSYFLQTHPNDALRKPISRVGEFCFTVKCAYRRNYTITYDAPLVPLIGKTELDLGGGVGRFAFEIALYEDEGFNQPYMLDGSELPTIDVPNYIYVDISIVNPVENIRLLVRRCRASNTNPVNPNPMGTYRLINQRCPIAPLLTVIHEDQHDYRFGFPSFYWVDETLEQLLYIICQVRVCDVSSNNCEESECDDTKRRRRKVKDQDETYRNLLVGPIRLVTSNPCGENNGGCSHLCVGLENGYRCECREGYVLLEDGRNCIDQSALNSQQGLGIFHLNPYDSISEISFSLDFTVVSVVVFVLMISMLATLRLAKNIHRISPSAKHADPYKHAVVD